MFSTRVMVFKMSKMAYFFVFFADNSKKLIRVSARYLSASGGSHSVLAENGMVNGVLDFAVREILWF